MNFNGLQVRRMRNSIKFINFITFAHVWNTYKRHWGTNTGCTPSNQAHQMLCHNDNCCNPPHQSRAVSAPESFLISLARNMTLLRLVLIVSMTKKVLGMMLTIVPPKGRLILPQEAQEEDAILLPLNTTTFPLPLI